MDPILLKPTSTPMKDNVTGNSHHYNLSPIWLPSVRNSMDKGRAVGVYPNLQQTHLGSGWTIYSGSDKWGGLLCSNLSSHQFEILERDSCKCSTSGAFAYPPG